MISYSPSGALSPYYYKGGAFHGIHYGGYAQDRDAPFAVMGKEEAFLLQSPQTRRILIGLYETVLPDEVLSRFAAHIQTFSACIYKLAISAGRRELRRIKRALGRTHVLDEGQLFFSEDMEAAKTWLVQETTGVLGSTAQPHAAGRGLDFNQKLM